MKKYNSLFYLLFILLIMGSFASMAQNSYGMMIIGGVAFAFSLIFIAELVIVLRTPGKKDFFIVLEPVCLLILALVFGCRVFYIYFSYVEMLFSVAGGVLAVIYLRKMLSSYRELKTQNKLLAMLVTIYYLSIAVFLCSLVIIPFVSEWAQGIGIAAFVLLSIFVVAGFFSKGIWVNGEKVSVFTKVARFKDHSIVIISLFILFSLYIGFNKIGILPGIYSDEYPRAYFELVQKAAAKKDRPVDGRYKYEEFMEQYKRFVEHNNGNWNK